MLKYFIADTHFNHENIIKYCNRPFINSKEMNEYIESKWNSIVTPNDIVYHLGDVGFGTTEELNIILNRLNGMKILIKGNHDIRRGTSNWKEIGFTQVYKKKLIVDNLILTHEPIDVEEGYINVFGHIHNKPLDEKFKKNSHICVSCDVIDYTPVLVQI